jgi:hypothetical protein
MAYFTSLFEGIGRTSEDALEGIVPGSRNGNTPVGEAWLFEETKR